MTAKEKAKDLINRMTVDMSIDKWQVKQCALIAVDEILNCPQTFDTEQVKYSDGTYAREYYEIPNRYWTKVKNEIELL